MKKVKKLVGLFIFLVIPSLVIAQVKDEKDFVKKLKSAANLYAINDYNNALKIYTILYQFDSTNKEVAFNTAICIYNLKTNKQESLRYFIKAKALGYSEASFFIGKLYHLNYKFDEAALEFANYKNINNLFAVPDSELTRLKASCIYAKKMMLNKNNVTIENLGDVINSEYSDYVPLISGDESILIFTSRRNNSTGQMLDPNGDYYEDIYISKKENGFWTSPKSISKGINTEGHDACVAISADGENLIVYKTSEDILSGDLYISHFTGKDWTIPEILGSDINTYEYIEASASISSDNSTLYFSSNRPGGNGQKDIYRVVKLPDGTWSKAINLGKSINTPYDEDAPFIHPNGKTLYFSSRGYQTMGGYDIFRSTYDEETETWSEPINMEYPINTVDDDIYFVLSANGKTGYYSANTPNGFGSTDLYKINMPDHDFKVLAFSGRIIDEADEPVIAKVTVREKGTEDLVGVYKTNKFTGKYLMILSPIKNYVYKIEAEGYPPITGNLLLNEDILTRMKKLQDN